MIADSHIFHTNYLYSPNSLLCRISGYLITSSNQAVGRCSATCRVYFVVPWFLVSLMILQVLLYFLILVIGKIAYDVASLLLQNSVKMLNFEYYITSLTWSSLYIFEWCSRSDDKIRTIYLVNKRLNNKYRCALNPWNCTISSILFSACWQIVLFFLCIFHLLFFYSF